MRAQNLAISIPKTEKCNKDCPYCISRMTGYLKPNFSLFWRNMKKVKTLAKHTNITSVLITGKGEPTQSICTVLDVLNEFNEFPTELQTNGKALHEKPELIVKLYQYGLNVLAISIDNPNEILKYKNIVKQAQELGILVRYTINMTNRFKKYSYEELFSQCKIANIDQLSLREVTIPTDSVNTEESVKAQEWITKNVSRTFVSKMNTEMLEKVKQEGRFLMSLPYGAKLYELNGVSITWFEYCVQDSNNGEDIRSLIYQEDGHMYLSWNSKASRMF